MHLLIFLIPSQTMIQNQVRGEHRMVSLLVVIGSTSVHFGNQQAQMRQHWSVTTVMSSCPGTVLMSLDPKTFSGSVALTHVTHVISRLCSKRLLGYTRIYAPSASSHQSSCFGYDNAEIGTTAVAKETHPKYWTTRCALPN